MEKMEKQNSTFVHKRVMGMYPPHIFLTDWLMALWQTKKAVFFWILLMMIDVMGGIVFGIIDEDFCGFVLLIMLMFSTSGMMYVGTPYNGLCKKMGLPHLMMNVPVIYIILRLSMDLGCNSSFFCTQITYNNKRALFIYLIVTLVLFTFVLVMDCIDIYIWYIKGDHAVVRSIGTLNKLISLGFLEPSTQQTQVIQQNHIRPETIDEFGYKIT
eukprot:278460_1